MLYSSPRPLPSQHARPKWRSKRSIHFVSHTLLSKRQKVSQRGHKERVEMVTMSADVFAPEVSHPWPSLLILIHTR